MEEYSENIKDILMEISYKNEGQYNEVIYLLTEAKKALDEVEESELFNGR